MATMSDGNPVPGPILCPVDVSIAFSIDIIVKALVDYKKTIDSLRKKLCENGDENGDENEITKAEETLKASLDHLSEVCQDYILRIVSPVVDILHLDSLPRQMWIEAYRDLERAILSTNLPDNSTKAAMRAYYMTISAIVSIENAIKTLSTIEALNAFEAIKGSFP